MPNMLTNSVAKFLKPAAERTYVDDVITDCALQPVSASEKNWARFTGVAYDFKMCVVLSEAKRIEVTEEWRVQINSVNYSVKDITHRFDNSGYDHSTFNLTKI